MEPPNILIVGKTHYLKNFLNTRVGVYDRIHLVCPTFSTNSTWQSWKYKDDPELLVYETFNVNVALCNIQRYHNQQEDTTALIILDEVASTKDISKQKSELTKLSSSGRHSGFEIIVLTQQLTSVSKSYRQNVTKLIALYMAGKKTLKYW